MSNGKPALNGLFIIARGEYEVAPAAVGHSV
jgi:hypothetical protein